MIAIDCNGLFLFIFQEKWPYFASGPKSAPNSESFWMRRLFNVCVRVYCAPNATILLVYIPAKIKISFIWKDEFFFAKIYACGFSVSQMRQFGLFTYPPRSKWAPASRSQAHWAKPYSFGWRIKLIICQIRHELSVNIHEITTSWKKY